MNPRTSPPAPPLLHEGLHGTSAAHPRTRTTEIPLVRRAERSARSDQAESLELLQLGVTRAHDRNEIRRGDTANQNPHTPAAPHLGDVAREVVFHVGYVSYFHMSIIDISLGVASAGAPQLRRTAITAVAGEHVLQGGR